MSRMPSVMGQGHNFASIPAPRIQRSSFDRSFGHKTTFDPGGLYPIMSDEILPGDTVNMNASFFARIATLLYPIMDNVFLDVFFFYVPSRILWDNWERFMGAQDNPNSSIDFQIPQITGDEDDLVFEETSLGDYFGLPTGVIMNETASPINALPFRAYNMIWNEWFRNETTENSVPFDTGDGPDLHTDYSVLPRGKRHDYFSSCLPYPQKGASVTIPLGTTAPLEGEIVPVVGSGLTLGLTTRPLGGTDVGAYTVNGSNDVLIATNLFNTPTGTVPPGGGAPATARSLGVSADPTLSGLQFNSTGMTVDLTSATSATINQLREAFAIQQLLEMDARGGTRYIEMLRYQFGVQVPDFRLNRPEYLGGSSQAVGVRSVAQTSEDGTTPQGNLAGYAQVGSSCSFVKSFVEHGYIIGLANVRADITYQQGLHKMWTRSTRYDFYNPVFAHLGEQAVLNQEIMYQNNASDITTFGYQERWAEMRYKPSYVTGAFRSNAAVSLDAWHLALDFATLPQLDEGFINDAPPLSRVTAVDETAFPGQQILLDCYFKYRHARPMPVYSIPGLERL